MYKAISDHTMIGVRGGGGGGGVLQPLGMFQIAIFGGKNIM